MVIWCELHCVNSYFRYAIKVINTRSAVTERAMGGPVVCSSWESTDSKLQNHRKIFQKLHCVLALSSIKSEEVGEVEVQEPKSTAPTQVWAGLPRSELHMSRSANETNQNNYLWNGCGFFPTWIHLMDIEPPLCQDRTKDCCFNCPLWNLVWLENYAIDSIYSHSTFIISLLDRITLTKSFTKVTNAESAFTVTST